MEILDSKHMLKIRNFQQTQRLEEILLLYSENSKSGQNAEFLKRNLSIAIVSKSVS